MAKDRFDLENDINALWSSATDLKTVAEMMYDSDFIYNDDRRFNVLYGLAEVMEAKLGRLEDTFYQVFHLNEYSSNEMKEARAYMMNCFKETKSNIETETKKNWEDFFDKVDASEWPDRDEGM